MLITSVAVAEGHAAQGHGKGPGTGVARLSGEHGDEVGEDDDAVEGFLENPDDGGRDEAGEEIEPQSRMARAEAPSERVGKAFALFDPDHPPCPGADPDGERFEEALTAHLS